MSDKREGFLPPMKRYMNAIERRLDLPRDVRARVMSDLATTVTARRENGESDDAIRESLGTPRKVAAELNEQMAEFRYKKSPWRFAFLALGIFAVLWLLWGVIVPLVFTLAVNDSASVGIIGGADGPTAIFVATATGAWVDVVAALAVLAVAVVGYLKFRRVK